MRRLLLVVWWVASACGAEPHWSLALGALDRVPLSVWADDPHNVYVAGGALGSGGDGLFLHFDGAIWREVPIGSTATLWWVFGLGPREVYLAGERGTLLHF